MEIDQLTNDLSEALDKVIAKRRGTQIFAVLAVAAGVVASAAMFITEAPDNRHEAIGPLFFSLFVVIWLSKSFSKSLSGFTMPILCDLAGGYTYSAYVPGEKSKRLADAGLLPNSGEFTCRHLIGGLLGETRFSYWSSRTVGGGGDFSSALFDGYVLMMSPIPASDNLLVGSTRNKVVREMRDVVGSAQPKLHHVNWGRWVDKDADYVAFFDSPEREQEISDWVKARIIRTNEMLGHDARFYGLLSDGNNSYIAIHGKTPHFVVGGLFADKASLLREMHRAMGELSLPGKLLEIWQSD